MESVTLAAMCTANPTARAPTRYVESRRTVLSAVNEILTPCWQFKNGNVYEGEYKEGKICGYGWVLALHYAAAYEFQ
jgi:hypothetical protein